MNLKVETAVEAGVAKIAALGEVDVSNADELRAAADAVLADEAVAEIEIDLGEVPYIDSTGIGVLVGSAHKAADAGKRFSVLNPQPNVVRILGLLGVDEVLELKAQQ